MTALALLVCLAAWLALTYALMSQSGLARRARQTGRHLLIAAIAALSALGMWQSFDELGPSWRAVTGHGAEGAFTPERVDVTGRGGHREWRGTFVSTDQRTIRRRVVLDNPPDRMRIGLAVPARDTGGAKGCLR